nr:isocitrate lyase/phosphoenolpyruvate mutase family protein [Clostridium pasteurianum]
MPYHIIEKQRDLAKKFQKIHKTDGMFILPNVWSAGSACIFEKQRFKAVAITSD